VLNSRSPILGSEFDPLKSSFYNIAVDIGFSILYVILK
jgi:hypothetical protein